MSRCGRPWLLRALVLAAVGTTLWLAPPAAAADKEFREARTFYVSPTGDDAGPGTRRRPWLTLQHAVDAAPLNSTITVAAGTYAPFVASVPRQTIAAAPEQKVVVRGAAGVRDVVLVRANGVRLSRLTVAGCEPDPAPRNGFERNGSSAIRIEADNVLVSGVTVRNADGVNAEGLPFGCFGVFVREANGTQLVGNDISGTGTGVYFNGGGRDAEVTGNTIHDNDVIVRNSAGGNDDFGGSGIALTNLTEAPGPVVRGNTLTGNAGPSSDYEVDGGAFELYNASNVLITDNSIADNENVLETGTAPGGTCSDNTFSENTASGRAADSTLTRSVGMILRCATDMRITRNTFTGIDWWIFTLEGGDQFASDVHDLVITRNTFDQWQKVYHLGVDPTEDQVVVDKNQIHFTGPIFSSYLDGSTSPGLVDWQQVSGLDLASTQF